jgi:CDGSH-type Zn-finger protein
MAKVTILQNGPVIIEDDEYLLIQSPVFSIPEFTKKVAICRCTKSKNGVWCDGSHKENENKNKNQQNE